MPSCSRLAASRYAARTDQALLVVDVILEFIAEMLHETSPRQCRRISQGADRAPHDVPGDVGKQIQILLTPAAGLDPVHHAIHPPCAFPARRALAAGLFEVEIRQALPR